MTLGFACQICIAHGEKKTAYCGFGTGHGMIWVCIEHFQELREETYEDMIKLVSDYEKSG